MHSQRLAGDSIERKGERIAVGIISIRMHVPNSPRVHAMRLLYTDLVQSGAGKYDRESWQHALGNLGSAISVAADGGDVNFSLNALDTALPKTLRLFREMFASPLFAEKELRRAKKHLENKLTIAAEDARAASYQIFSKEFFSKTDRRAHYTPLDLKKELKNIAMRDIARLHESLWEFPWIYTSGGNSDSNKQFEATARSVHGLSQSSRAAKLHSMSMKKIDAIKTLLHSIPSKQNIEFSIGGALPLTRNDEMYPAFVFGMNVLAIPSGFAGRLMSTVREKEGLTYSIYGRTESATAEEHGVWRISTFFTPKDAVTGIASTLREVRKIRSEGITEDELVRFKQIIHTGYVLTEDSLLRKVSESHSLKKLGIDMLAYAQFKEKIQDLKRSEVNAVLSTHLNDACIVISGAGPVKAVEKELKQLNSAH